MRYLLPLFALLSLSACAGLPSQPQTAALSSQAFMPHDPASPTSPCQGYGLKAFLPHDPAPHFPTPYPTAQPCPCQHGLQTQAALPPDFNPGHPANCQG